MNQLSSLLNLLAILIGALLVVGGTLGESGPPQFAGAIIAGAAIIAQAIASRPPKPPA